MTILQVCAYAAPYEGNFIKSLKMLGDKLKQKGHRMIYAFPENAKEMQWCKELETITDVYYLPLAKARMRIKTYYTLNTICKNNPDLKIVHSHFELYDIPVILMVSNNIKVFWHLHDALEDYSGFKNRIVHRIQYGLLHKNALLLSVSEKHMNYVLHLGFPKKNAQYIPNGLDIKRIKLVESEVSERKYDFLIFGWEFARKGVDLCIDAVKRIPEKITVGIVGSKETQEIIKTKYGIICGVEVLEPVEDINTLYNASKCFLHISRAEGLSYALMEAVYAGLPVICSDIKENRFAEVFDTVRMVRSEDIVDIAAAMNDILKKKSLEKKHVLIARNIIEDQYSIERWIKNVLQQYEV